MVVVGGQDVAYLLSINVQIHEAEHSHIPNIVSENPG